MRLSCNVETINRHLIGSCKRRAVKSTLALGKEPKDPNAYWIMHFASVCKLGTKYKVTGNVEKVFTKYCKEGKATIRFSEPAYDMCINSDPLQLVAFLKALKLCLDNNVEGLKALRLSTVAVMAKDTSCKKLTITPDGDSYPVKGLPRTLESLQLSLGLARFDRAILLLRHLHTLDLSDNKIQKIPPELGNMPQLKEIILRNNDLGNAEIPDWKWIEGVSIRNNLRLLDLSSNSLGQNLPHSISKLVNLSTLKLDNNNLTYLPKGIGRITDLKYLSVASNSLNSLPSNITNLNLVQLDISSNKFEGESKHPSVKITFSMKTLLEACGSVVLNNRLFYSKSTIPFTLVEYLDDSNYCMCGKATLDEVNFTKFRFSVGGFCQSIVQSNNFPGIDFDCYFCSLKCYRQYIRLRKHTQRSYGRIALEANIPRAEMGH